MNPTDFNSVTLLAVGVIEQVVIYEPQAAKYYAGEIFAGEV